MKKKIFAILLALAILATGCSGQSGSTVAEVNGEEISFESFKEEYNTYRKMIYGQLSDEEMRQDTGTGESYASALASQVVDTMIMDTIIKQEYDSLGLEVSQETKDEAMTNLIEQSDGQEAYEDQLDLLGITAEEMESIVDKTLIQEAVRNNFLEENEKSDEEIKQYFESNKDQFVTYDVSHILVESEEEAREIIEELEAGADFGELARERSTDQGSAEQGGDLGEISMQTNFVQPFLDAVREMEEGDISDPVESEYGFHIIKVNSVSDDVSDHEEAIQNILLDSEVNAYFQGLYDSSEIAKYKPSLDDITEEDSDGTEDSTEEGEASEEDQASDEEESEETE